MTIRKPLVPVVVFLVAWTLTTHGKYSVSGDEPHYLIVSESLWSDGDLNLENNHTAGDSSRFGVDRLEPGLHARTARHGAVLSVHDIGLSVALLPVYVAATRAAARAPEPVLARFRMTRGLFGYSLISLFMIALTALAAAITHAALVAAAVTPAVATAVVLAVWLSPPVLSNSFLVFPEIAALVVTAWAVRVALAKEAVTRRAWVILAAALGLLPWFHRKFVVYGFALLLVVVWHQRAALSSWSLRRALVAAALLAGPSVALAVWSWYYWGAVGGPLTLERAPFALEAFRTGWVGQLVDRESGLFVWAPIYLLLPAAWALAGPAYWAWLLPAAALLLMSAAHDQWWGGFSPACRFLVPLAPVFCAVGVAVARQWVLRTASLLLVIPQVLISAYGWQHPRALWTQGDGHNQVVGTWLDWIGVGEEVLPSLRLSPSETATAIGIVVMVIAANGVLLWVGRARSPAPIG